MAWQTTNGFPSAFRSSHRHDESSIVEEARAFVFRSAHRAWRFWRSHGRTMAVALLIRFWRQVHSNLSRRRLLSFPHLLVAVWLIVLLWGERWVFGSQVERCQWDEWEHWPPGSRPHHVALVADPQLIDPHSYPGRPWPINPLTFLVTDNYLRRSYQQLVTRLQPDTIFFLGDLFDGGREWKTVHGEFRDPEWGHRPGFEKKLLKKWNKKYAEAFWLREYGRFGDIFLAPWKAAGTQKPGAGQRGRKLVASLPGNHDLGFGSEIKMSVRNRFEAYFGEGNRVDVVGNHTFVSVDTVSLSAGTSTERSSVEGIFKPTEIFLSEVQRSKRKAVAKELRFLRGEVEEVPFAHRVEELDKADFSDVPNLDPGQGQADLPSVLLTHVPLYRPPGTPCGPLREHWPPAKPPRGQDGPVVPDHRNAISVSGGYQYQNVLNEETSVSLVNKVGNVVHAFSGDDHDYCELRHDERHGFTPEITVKSISMAMGVPTPGFVLLSLHNPVDGDGKPLPGSSGPTLQTRLCLLPNQLRTYSRYAILGVCSVLLLILRAFLVPTLSLEPFALDSSESSSSLFAKARPGGGSSFTSASASSLLPTHREKAADYHGRNPGASGFSTAATSSPHSRDRSQSGSQLGSGATGQLLSSPGAAGRSGRQNQPPGRSPRHSSASHPSRAGGRWGWGSNGIRAPLKIEIRADEDDEGVDSDPYDGGKWKVSTNRRGRSLRTRPAIIWRELWTTAWRVAWMVLCIWGWLAWKG